MKDATKADRRAHIEAAALTVLQQRGYDGASMLNIAKAAKASNETLYRWYGDKAGLFGEIVKANTAAVDAALDEIAAQDLPPKDALPRVANLMLHLLLGPRAVALNRAAAADKTGELGAALAAGGRERIFPRIAALMAALRRTNAITAPSDAQAAEWFLNLLIGDLQMRRVIGTLPPLSGSDIDARAKSSVAAFYALCASPGKSSGKSSGNGV